MVNPNVAKRARHAYVVRKKGVRGGTPIVGGTGIKVIDIAIRYHVLGNSLDEIIAAYPDLSLSQVPGAPSYYYQYKEEVDKDWKESMTNIEQLREEHKSVLESRYGKVKDLH